MEKNINKEKQKYALRITNGKEKGIVGDMYFVASHTIGISDLGMSGRVHQTARMDAKWPYSKPKLYLSEKRAETIAKKYNEYNFNMYQYEVVPASY